VLFAQLDGRRVAEFPSVPGLSAPDVAEHAVAESAVAGATVSGRPWIDGRDDGMALAEREAGRRVATARAELFKRSLDDGEPVIATEAALEEARA
jgi:hypothetical protein